VVKVRFQGTEADIERVLQVLERCDGIELKNVSDPLGNVGTKRYVRRYAHMYLPGGEGNTQNRERAAEN